MLCLGHKVDKAAIVDLDFNFIGKLPQNASDYHLEVVINLILQMLLGLLKLFTSNIVVQTLNNTSDKFSSVLGLIDLLGSQAPNYDPTAS